MKRIIALIWLLVVPVYGQSPVPTPPPALTETQKLQLQVISQKLEIAQLKAQAAQRDFDTAREDFSKLLASLQKEGFTLDLQKLEYAPKPKDEAKPK